MNRLNKDKIQELDRDMKASFYDWSTPRVREPFLHLQEVYDFWTQIRQD